MRRGLVATLLVLASASCSENPTGSGTPPPKPPPNRNPQAGFSLHSDSLRLGIATAYQLTFTAADYDSLDVRIDSATANYQVVGVPDSLLRTTNPLLRTYKPGNIMPHGRRQRLIVRAGAYDSRGLVWSKPDTLTINILPPQMAGEVITVEPTQACITGGPSNTKITYRSTKPIIFPKNAPTGFEPDYRGTLVSDPGNHDDNVGVTLNYVSPYEGYIFASVFTSNPNPQPVTITDVLNNPGGGFSQPVSVTWVKC